MVVIPTTWHWRTSCYVQFCIVFGWKPRLWHRVMCIHFWLRIPLALQVFHSPDPSGWDSFFTCMVDFMVSRTGDGLIGVVRDAHTSYPLSPLHNCVSECWLWPLGALLAQLLASGFNIAVKKQILLKLVSDNFLGRTHAIALESNEHGFPFWLFCLLAEQSIKSLHPGSSAVKRGITIPTSLDSSQVNEGFASVV